MKCVNKHAVAKITNNEYKEVLLNKKCLRHSINRIQNKNHKIGSYEIYKTFLTCFVDKINILDHGFDALTLGSSI